MTKTVLITGGTRGIGRAVAHRLARDGYRLAIAYRGDAHAAQQTAAELDSIGAQHRLYQADLADPQQAAALPARIVADFGTLDGLVNNAGMTDDGAFLTMEGERYQRVLDTNLFGTMRLTSAALPYLLQADRPAIVIVSSLGGVVGKEGQVTYATTKGALIGLTQWLGRKYGPQGLRVNAVAPGFIRTDMMDSLEPSMYQHIIEGSALQRIGDAEEVADAVAFLLSPGYIQATTLRVDGGFQR
ncbi:SDR family NAD(P)-dependent oxidoreductase [Paraherbaspirillum soli]|uniref:SDR family NAD(P)-dependent oxidoreductase n=1 Tax=Paraherbaspirillum soli TaxID=631222 RepID=A0ABW0M966_9BURK